MYIFMHVCMYVSVNIYFVDLRRRPIGHEEIAKSGNHRSTHTWPAGEFQRGCPYIHSEWVNISESVSTATGCVCMYVCMYVCMFLLS